MKKTGWHKGSRFWGTGYPTLLLSFGLSVYLQESLPFITMIGLLYGLGGLWNVQEAKNREKGTEK